MPPAIFVLFGATGDLARRMVLPAFAALAVNDLMPEQWVLIGNGRKDEDDAWFADHVRDVLDDEKAFAAVDDHLMFAGNGFTVDDPGDLPATVARAREQVGEDALLVHYIALPPSTFEPYVQALDAHGLAKGARVVFEKPYGTSPSAFDHLEQVVHGVLDEEQVYRLDHFLGKEATQNLHVLRFANGSSATSGATGASGRCRSTCPRPSTSTTVPGSTTRPAPPWTWSSRTCSRWPPRSPWSRRRRWARATCSPPASR